MRTLSFLLVILLSACASTPPPRAGPAPGRPPVRRAHRADQHRRRAQGERRDAPLSRGRHRRPDPHQGAAGRAGRCALPPRPAQARVRRGHHQDRRRGVRRPLRQLPVAGADDGGAGARARSSRCATRAPTWKRRGAATATCCSPAATSTSPSAGACSTPARSRDLSPWTIDFLPADEIRTLRVRDIDESTVLAMYANNRAAEALARGKLDDAYAWAAEALRKDPTFMNSYNTLGVVYLRHSDLAQAERVFGYVLERDAEEHPGAGQPRRDLHPAGDAGRCRGGAHPAGGDRGGAAVPLLQPRPRRRPAERLAHAPATSSPARSRAPTTNHEFHFWLGLADWQLGDDRPGAQAPAAGDGQQHHPRPARSLRRQAGLAAVAAEARAVR